MSRLRKPRKVVAPPGFKGYRPYGTHGHKRGTIDILYEEYEAIKLADYDMMNHLEASKIMGISRPTFARIYESARQKIARAMVESKEIIMIYGNAVMDESWYICRDCNARFTIPPTVKKQSCALCSSANTLPIIQNLK